ncbi:MAG: flagellar export protein FliJ [Geobacter sp.]|nr:MAG: flagellar export protein FliJ [Geobacter sp.]
MASKRFELEQVLKYRTEVERVRKQEFVVAKQNLEHATDRLDQEKAQVDGLSKEFCDRHKELCNIEDVRIYADFFTRKREEIKEQKERIVQLGHIVNDRRETLLDASKDKKVLESLKEKKAQEFRIEMDKKEQLFMDEIAVQKKGKPSQ